MTTPIQHIDGTKEGKLKAYAQLATLGLTMAGLYEIAPIIIDGPGGIPGWMTNVENTGLRIQNLPIIGGASILGVIPYLSTLIKNARDHVPKTCGLPFIKKGSWLVPVGRTNAGKWMFHDFAGSSPHTLVPGSTGSGKSVFLQYVLYVLCHQQNPKHLIIDIIDLKQGATFDVWGLLPHVRKVRYDIAGAHQALSEARRAMNERLEDIRRAKRSFKPIPGHSHYFIVIDEGSLLSLDDTCLDLLQEISAIGREPRLHILYSTQRPSSKVLPTEIRDQLEARFCFRVNEPGSSEIVLGRDNLSAYELDRKYKGRCVMQTPAGECTLQTPFLTDAIRDGWLSQFVVEHGAVPHIIDTTLVEVDTTAGVVGKGAVIEIPDTAGFW